MKSVLAAHGVGFRRTHDLVDLADVLSDSGFALPDEVRAVVSLNPFVVEARYDFLPPTSVPLDRAALRRQVRALRTWAEAVVGQVA